MSKSHMDALTSQALEPQAATSLALDVAPSMARLLSFVFGQERRSPYPLHIRRDREHRWQIGKERSQESFRSKVVVSL